MRAAGIAGNMKTVVTGGTGFVGSALVAQLVARGDDVVVLTRGGARREGQVRFVPWSPGQDGPWTLELDDADAVVHLAGQGIFDKRWSPEYIELCLQSRVQPTTHLAAALAGAKPRPRTWVSASAVGYYGMACANQELTESASAGNDVLAKMALAWEAATHAAKVAGVRVCHARLGLVLGTQGGALAKMLPPFRAFVGGPLGDGKQPFPWVHLDDAAAAIAFATTSPWLSGAFNLCSPNPVSMNEFAEQLGAALGRPAMFRVPAFALRIALGTQAEALLTGQRALPAALLAAGFRFRYETLGAALTSLLKAA
jgi:uncharacterized protein